MRFGPLPRALVVVAAVLLAMTGDDQFAQIVAVVHAAMLVAALWWPVPAWAASSVLLVWVQLTHPPGANDTMYGWLVQAGIVLLLALRLDAGKAALFTAAGVLPVLPGGPLAVVAVAGAGAAGWLIRSRRDTQAALAEERGQRALLEERARIARELHDVVAHHMSVIAIQADAGPHRVADPPPELTEAFATIRSTALEGLGELRRLLGLLRAEPDVSPQPSLTDLDRLAAGATLETTGDLGDVPRGVGLNAYRIVQEALTNTMWHAPGAAVTVRVVRDDRELRIGVTNTRPHDPPKAGPGAGHGILGMRERAAMLGGTLTTGPTADGGYAVSAVLPLTETS
ncbi:sensor histidine kinase [Herbidospora sp. NEAU-GS84]|uniref:histidine kinase n=1 Tax=Herbidospora solisilvae TaxID=2696284 RepID=A0A7C9J2B3_9ACTN|nr:sensor histidine kinase [Herbidospora solisilvae]NAS22265.1 sensor histidine kinase [Herbidospora solisilvae]